MSGNEFKLTADQLKQLFYYPALHRVDQSEDPEPIVIGPQEQSRKCPFCNWTPLLVLLKYKTHSEFMMACINSECRVQPATDSHENAAVAQVYWG